MISSGATTRPKVCRSKSLIQFSKNVCSLVRLRLSLVGSAIASFFLGHYPRADARGLSRVMKENSCLPLALRRGQLFRHAKDDAKSLVALGQFFGVDRMEFGSQRVGSLKPIGHGILVGEILEADLLDAVYSDVSNAWDIAPLTSPHHPPAPEADRLRLFATPDRREKFLLKKQHAQNRIRL